MLRVFGLALCLTSLTLGVSGFTPRRANGADLDLNGNWKLTLLGPLVESDFLVLSLKGESGNLKGEVKNLAQPIPEPPKLTQASFVDGLLSVTMKVGTVEGTFAGKAAGNDRFLGMLKVGPENVPARLQKTKAEVLDPPPQQPPQLVRTYFQARGERDPKKRVKVLQGLLAQTPGSPTLGVVYADVIRGATAAGLSDGEVRTVVKEWLEGAQLFGKEQRKQVLIQASLALQGQKAFSNLALEIAKEADAVLGKDDAVQTRADVVKALVEAAQLNGEETLAAKGNEKAAKLEAELDADYHAKVPPFKPEGRLERKRESKRVVLMELFTGAQCPPCVAADVAFDAMSTTYETTELATLQYHLHIPGADPLTNADSVARAGYYPRFNGTPSVFLDGQALPPGGGPMSFSEEKYKEYRSVIDRVLQRPAGAKIDLKVTREGQVLKIRAYAESSTKASTKQTLRLAITEEQIRYTGSNGLRFHQHVVRTFPGGVGGKALSGGKAETELVVRLNDLRKGLESYLSTYERDEGGFPKKLPGIDLAGLSVVAFVQDDDTKGVLNAAVEEVK